MKKFLLILLILISLISISFIYRNDLNDTTISNTYCEQVQTVPVNIDILIFNGKIQHFETSVNNWTVYCKDGSKIYKLSTIKPIDLFQFSKQLQEKYEEVYILTD